MFPPWHRCWLCALSVAVLSFVASTAFSQSCHTPTLRQAGETAFRLSLAGEAASYDNDRFSGEYQALRLGAAYQQRHFMLGASLPYYRLVRNGLPERGVGDAAMELRVPIAVLDDMGLSFGPELAVSFPSGDASRDLGMGHTMLMPGGFVSLRQPRLTVIGQLAYGRSTGGGHGTHHHGGAGPIVNPMNSSEIEHALSVGVQLVSLLQVLGRVAGAVPLFDKQGVTREVASIGLTLVLGPVDVSVEQQFAVLGTPFDSKTCVAVASQW